MDVNVVASISIIGIFVISFSLYILQLKLKNSTSSLKPFLYIPSRKSSTDAILLGGLPLAVGFALGIGYIIPIFSTTEFASLSMIAVLKGTLFSLTIIGLFGYFDDKFEISAKIKLLGQISSVSILFEYLSSIWPSEYSLLMLGIGVFYFSLGVMNGLNLLDGMDGLTVKLNSTNFICFLWLSIYLDMPHITYLSMLGLALLASFYYFNQRPAKIHLGEIGANFLGIGYVGLAITIFINAYQTMFIYNAMALAILPLTTPLIELAVSFGRRIINGGSPFNSDKLHLHHLLYEKYNYSINKTTSLMGWGNLFSIGIGIVLSQMLNPMLGLLATVILQLSFHIGIGARFWVNAKNDTKKNVRDKIIDIEPALRKKEVLLIHTELIDNFYFSVSETRSRRIEKERKNTSSLAS